MYEIKIGNVLDVIKEIDDNSIDCSITSPPYWGLRNYQHDDQIGQESSPEKFVENMVNVCREVRRVLKPEGTFWLNIGDTRLNKCLVGVPWMLAFALKEDGWFLRSDIIWHKPNPMPESVKDRPTSAHEHIFFFAKSKSYYYDAESIKTDSDPEAAKRANRRNFAHHRTTDEWAEGTGLTPHRGFKKEYTKANKRDVWSVPVKTYKGAHFATYPEDLIEPCVLAGCPSRGTILDPFSGAATTGVVACRNNRNYVGIELNPDYAELSIRRLEEEAGLENLLN